MTSITFLLEQSRVSTEDGGTSLANWAPHALDGWQAIRELHQDIVDLREGLHAALDLIADRDRQIARLKDHNLSLRTQRHATVLEAQQPREYLSWLDSLYHEGPNQPAGVSDAL